MAGAVGNSAALEKAPLTRTRHAAEESAGEDAMAPSSRSRPTADAKRTAAAAEMPRLAAEDEVAPSNRSRPTADAAGTAAAAEIPCLTRRGAAEWPAAEDAIAPSSLSQPKADAERKDTAAEMPRLTRSIHAAEWPAQEEGTHRRLGCGPRLVRKGRRGLDGGVRVKRRRR